MIHVLIVSPTPAMRAGLRALLSGDPDFDIEAGISLVDLDALDGPAPVIIATPGGIDLAAASLRPGTALLLVSGEAQELQTLSGAGLRAWGVISPEATAEALQAAVRALAEGLVIATPELLRQALPGRPGAAGSGAPDGDDEDPVEPLTERENDVLLRLAQGLTNKQIALALGISEHTVKFHVSSIYSKLGVSSRTEALRKGARRGWVPL